MDRYGRFAPTNRMNTLPGVSFFGLGYVGCVTAACLADRGFRVIGVDVTPSKIDLINSGQATIVEEGIAELVRAGHAAGRLSATTSVADAVEDTAISLICVGTPSQSNGNLDLSYVERVCTQIGEALRLKAGRHTVVIRSTVFPGTTATLACPALERASGKRAGADFGLAMNPEFLREGTSIRDFNAPPFTVIGADDEQTGRSVAALYDGIDAPLHVVATGVAEMLKYACNAYHGLKVGFANEIGNVCKALGVDSHEVMRLFVQDTKLNVSKAYLMPGFAFGGSCPGSPITYRARQLDATPPERHAESNELRSSVLIWSGRGTDAGSWSRVQGRDRRPPGVTDGRTGRTAHRQGNRCRDLRSRGLAGEADRREQGIHRARDPARVVAVPLHDR
jgi:GDP-mannose 6-dehydrogenase